ncbi:hypothetical protein [Corynebacterium guaraldiae]|uniref:hypothetical protein n=1 Tax=Corynebacterium guaraldiae TaxID=3051103 RepID=UPI0018AC4FE9|nr:hypothetical protein [Corynebacterium guaraldiae]
MTVAAPTAGAVGGYTYKEMEGRLSNPSDLTTWGYMGGYVNNVPTKGGEVDGFSTQFGTGENAWSIFYGDGDEQAKGFYSDAIPLGSVKVQEVQGEPLPGGSRDLSMSAKKLVFVASIVGNDIVKNEGLSEKTKQLFASAGYVGSDTDSGYIGLFGENYGVGFTHKRPDGLTAGDDDDDGILYNTFTQADVIAQLSSLIAGTAIYGDSAGYLEVTGENPLTGGNQTPVTMEQFEEAMTVGLQVLSADLVFAGASKGDTKQKEADTRALTAAFFNIAKAIPDNAVTNADIKVRHYVPTQDENALNKWISPWLVDFKASAVPSIDTLLPAAEPEPEPETPAEDLHITGVKETGDGNYVITRSDSQGWTINLSDLRNRIEALENKDTVSPEDLKKVQDDLGKILKETEDLKVKDESLQKEIDKLKGDVEGLDTRVKNLEGRVTQLEGSVIKGVVKNSDGTYTLIRVDGTKVPGNIDTSGSVTNVKTDGKGNLVVTIDGKDKTVPLDQVKVVEENKGTPDHTVTITTPDGKSVTFNVFDTYVTDIKWNEEKGLYEIYRSDVDGGKTVWKTIDLSDLRNRVDALEKKDSPSRDEYNALVKDVRENRELIEKLKEQNTAHQENLTVIEKQLVDMQADLDDIKARLTVVENNTDALTKCVAGAGAAGIPALLSIPLMVMTQLNIPGIKDLNTQIQKQIGMYNPELARAWERNGGVLQAGAVLAGLAGMIGSIAYIANQCDPMMKTPAGQDTDLGKLSSKLEKAKTESSSKKTESEKTEQNTPAESAAEAEANTDAEAATAPSEELVDAQ